MKQKVDAKRPFAITKTRKVVRLASNGASSCRECKESFPIDPVDLEKQVNHYLGHGYVLLYVGPEHLNTMTITVAILGK